MTNTTTEQPTVLLSCKHVTPWTGTDAPQVGDQTSCPKCKPKGDGTMASRTVKLVRQPGAPVGQKLTSHDTSLEQDMTRQAAEIVAEATDAAAPPADLKLTGKLPDALAADLAAEAAEVISFPDRVSRMNAARQAAKAVRDSGGTPKQAGKASDRIMAIPVEQAPVTDRSDRSPRRSSGAVTFLNLSAVRNSALLAAVNDDGAVIDGDKNGPEGVALKAIADVVSSGEKRLNLDAAGVRVLLRNLPRVADDQDQAGPIRNAAGRTAAWLQQHAEKAGYSPL